MRKTFQIGSTVALQASGKNFHESLTLLQILLEVYIEGSFN